MTAAHEEIVVHVTLVDARGEERDYYWSEAEAKAIKDALIRAVGARPDNVTPIKRPGSIIRNPEGSCPGYPAAPSDDGWLWHTTAPEPRHLRPVVSPAEIEIDTTIIGSREIDINSAG